MCIIEGGLPTEWLPGTAADPCQITWCYAPFCTAPFCTAFQIAVQNSAAGFLVFIAASQEGAAATSPCVKVYLWDGGS